MAHCPQLALLTRPSSLGLPVSQSRPPRPGCPGRRTRSHLDPPTAPRDRHL